MFFKKGYLKNFAISSENASVGISFLKVAGLKTSTLLKRDPNTGVFLRILQNF